MEIIIIISTLLLIHPDIPHISIHPSIHAFSVTYFLKTSYEPGINLGTRDSRGLMFMSYSLVL